jgi:23S rRNA (cytidine1920-2'-O)/16S rRNA (cytidine1409-2'-O)-methyltransferase
MKVRLDHALTQRGLVSTRSQAESWIRLGKVTVNGQAITKPGFFVDEEAHLALTATERYVSRAGLKLASVADTFHLDFRGKVVLDVGSSTGGFTDFALQHGAKKVIAVDVGTEQLHPSLRGDERIELHEKTDIRDFMPQETPDIVVIDVSFVSLRQILPHIATISRPSTMVVAMTKPQFEASRAQIGPSGVIRNDKVRRDILREFEQWVRPYFVISQKSDSEIKGAHGNHERFYVLKRVKG